MKRLLIILLLILLWAVGSYAQGPAVQQPDDEFNLFLLALAIAFFSIVIGAILVGSVVVTLAMFVLLGLVTAGVLSAGVLVGLYKKSISAGFKTIIAISGCLSGIVIGEIGFYFINRIFHLQLSATAVLGIGGFCGLVAGLLLGMVLFMLIRLFLNYCRARLLF